MSAKQDSWLGEPTDVCRGCRCHRCSPGDDWSGEKSKKQSSIQRSNFWTLACHICHFGTAYTTCRYRPQIDRVRDVPLEDDTRQFNTYISPYVEAWTHTSWWLWSADLLRPLRNPEPVVLLYASAAWGITTVYLLERYQHNHYQYRFLVAGISTSVLLGILTIVVEELPSYLAITYTPLWISFVMTSSMVLHYFL